MIVCSADLSGSVLCWRRDGSLPLDSKLLERDAAARDAALDRADRAAADLGRFLIGEAARADEDQRLALRLRQMHQRALHVAKLDMPVLARRRGEDLRRGDVVPLALEAGAAHLAEEQVAQDDEGPGAHVGAGLEALARRPGLEQRFLDEIVGEVAAARQRAAERAQVRDDRRELILELRIGQRDRLAPKRLRPRPLRDLRPNLYPTRSVAPSRGRARVDRT